MKYVNFGNEYDNNVHFEDVRLICGPHLVIIHISKIRASDESHARKINIITSGLQTASQCCANGSTS